MFGSAKNLIFSQKKCKKVLTREGVFGIIINVVASEQRTSEARERRRET